MLALFLLSVAVQYNDPDPVRWMAIYGAAAIVCVFEIRRRTPLWLPAGVAAIALLWGAIGMGYASHSDALGQMFAHWEMKNIHIEEERELYGLTIVTVWMVAVGIAGWRRRTRRGESSGPAVS